MSLQFFDRIKDTSATTGTGTLTLAGAATGYVAISTAYSNGDILYYCIVDQTQGANWEVGLGTYSSGGTTLARTTIIGSSNANAAVNFTSGSLYIFNTIPATLVVSKGMNYAIASGNLIM